MGTWKSNAFDPNCFAVRIVYLTSSEHLQIFLEIATEAALALVRFYKDCRAGLDAITEKDVLEIWSPSR